MASLPFRFKKFEVAQEGAAHLVGTDAVLLGAWADVSGVRTILDIGTGTGVVALMLAQRSADPVKLTAVEIHPPSAALARRNFAASPWSERLHVVEMPVQNFAQNTAERFDLIVSNPPFFSDLTVSPDPARQLGRHTASLSPGDLLEAVQQLLAPQGRFCVVLPAMEAQRLCELAVALGLYWTKIVRVRARSEKPVERWLVQFERDPYPLQVEELVIYERERVHTAMFQKWTGEFYLESVLIRQIHYIRSAILL